MKNVLYGAVVLCAVQSVQAMEQKTGPQLTEEAYGNYKKRIVEYLGSEHGKGSLKDVVQECVKDGAKAGIRYPSYLLSLFVHHENNVRNEVTYESFQKCFYKGAHFSLLAVQMVDLGANTVTNGDVIATEKAASEMSVMGAEEIYKLLNSEVAEVSMRSSIVAGANIN